MSQRTIAPILPVLDLKRAVEFYENVLDFKAIVFEEQNYVLLDRGNYCIHLYLTDDKYLRENSSCYLYAQDVDGLYNRIVSKGADYTRGAPQDKPWGMREFYVIDTEGNLLRIGKSINS